MEIVEDVYFAHVFEKYAFCTNHRGAFQEAALDWADLRFESTFGPTMGPCS